MAVGGFVISGMIESICTKTIASGLKDLAMAIATFYFVMRNHEDKSRRDDTNVNK